jgi:hypothetical protein
MLKAIALRQPQFPGRETWIRFGLSLTEGSIDGNAKIEILVPLVLDQLFSGDLPGARQTIERFHAITRSEPVSPLGIVFEKDAETFYNWLAGRFEESLQSMTAGIQLAASTGVHVLDFFLLGHGAAGALSAGDAERAGGILREMARPRPTSRSTLRCTACADFWG